MIAHFFLYTDWGSVVMVAVATLAVAVAVWNAVWVVTGLIAWAGWSLYRVLTR